MNAHNSIGFGKLSHQT